MYQVNDEYDDEFETFTDELAMEEMIALMEKLDVFESGADARTTASGPWDQDDEDYDDDGEEYE